MYYPPKGLLKNVIPKGSSAPIYKRAKISIGAIDAYSRLRNGGASFFLDSARTNSYTGRYSFIGVEPDFIFKSKGDTIELSGARSKRVYKGEPISELRKMFREYRYAGLSPAPFSGGACGYFSYDLCRHFEKVPSRAREDVGIPEIFLIFTDTVVAFDHIEGDVKVISNLRYNGSFDRGYDEAVERIDRVAERLFRRQRAEDRVRRKTESKKIVHKIESNFTKGGFEEMVRRAKRYIRAGDIYQANLSQRLSTYTEVEPFELYKVLRRINPSPFACFLEMGDTAIVSSSPERLLRLKGRCVETRPIAGTRPRGRGRLDDRRLSEELLLNEKERAEHIMLVDLERNDLGRVCDYGSVRVNELMALEDYSHVKHIVSNVRGRLKADKDRFDLIRAAFPGGTITGTPKVRCMQIIDELEPVARNIYTGSVGYLGYNGNMDLNIVIRTFLIKEKRAYVQVGAGIVADSDPAREYYETLYKAQALLETLKRVEGR